MAAQRKSRAVDFGLGPPGGVRDSGLCCFFVGHCKLRIGIVTLGKKRSVSISNLLVCRLRKHLTTVEPRYKNPQYKNPRYKTPRYKNPL